MDRLFFIKIQVLLVFLLTFSNCKKNEGNIVSRSPNEFSAEDQKVIGNRLLEYIQSDPAGFPLLERQTHPQAYRYLEDTILQPTVLTPQVQHRNDYQWQAHIIVDDEVTHAFMLPGGHYFIYTGLLKFLRGNYQLMAITAHEMFYADGHYLITALSNEFGKQAMGDLLLGKDVPELSDMARFLRTMDFEGKPVLAADSFSTVLICPFNYYTRGILDVIEAADSVQTRIDWVSRRNSERISREAQYRKLIARDPACAEGNRLLREPYVRFKNEYLP